MSERVQIAVQQRCERGSGIARVVAEFGRRESGADTEYERDCHKGGVAQMLFENLH
jgi:hypothetical protein